MGIDEGFYTGHWYKDWKKQEGEKMVDIIFCGFGDEIGKRALAKQGDILLRVAMNNGITIPTECKDGMCGSCAVKIEELDNNPEEKDFDSKVDPDAWEKEKYTTYMEDKELETLIEMGAITKKEAETAQQYAQQTPIRLACQCIIKGSMLVKPFE